MKKGITGMTPVVLMVIALMAIPASLQDCSRDRSQLELESAFAYADNEPQPGEACLYAYAKASFYQRPPKVKEADWECSTFYKDSGLALIKVGPDDKTWARAATSVVVVGNKPYVAKLEGRVRGFTEYTLGVPVVGYKCRALSISTARYGGPEDGNSYKVKVIIPLIRLKVQKKGSYAELYFSVREYPSDTLLSHGWAGLNHNGTNYAFFEAQGAFGNFQQFIFLEDRFQRHNWNFDYLHEPPWCVARFTFPDLVVTVSAGNWVELYCEAFAICDTEGEMRRVGAMVNTEGLSIPYDGVGGIVIPVDKFSLLAPYIGLASTILVATVATAIYAKRVKRKKEKQ